MTEALAALGELDQARAALVEARDDWDRLRVRDSARVLQAAAGILDRRDVQVLAANLVADAERALARANPPQQGKARPADAPKVPGLRDIRLAHSRLSDEAFEALKADAVEEGQPLTRRAVRLAGDRARVALRNAAAAEVAAAPPSPAPIPEGPYRVLVVDPPWPTILQGRVGRHYPTMPLREIAALELPADRCGCDLFLWVPSSLVPAAVDLVAGWGFEYRSLLAWHKSAGYHPTGWPYINVEFLVWGGMGGEAGLRPDPAFADVFEAPRRAHSEKPAAFYEVLARVSDGPRLDMFARHAHEGFEAWGWEAPA